MKYLLDTHAILWISNDDPRLTKKVREIYLKADHEMFISLASIWEMAIKISIKKLRVKNSLNYFVDNEIFNNNIKIINIELDHLFYLSNLPLHQRDPFDRLIISQAIERKLPIISAESFFDLYPVKRTW